MYKNLLTQILSLNESIPDIYVDVNYGHEVKSTKICKLSELTIFALNTVLVLEGKRLAYRVSVPDAAVVASLIRSVLEITRGDVVSLPLIPSEPLLVLKNNRSRVVQQFTKSLRGEFSENKVHIAFGEVLGYAYVGEDWVGADSDHLNVSYNVGRLASLYCFNVPMRGYTNAIRSRILEDLEKYRDTLKGYGYEVVLSVWSRSGETHCLLEALPEPTL